MIDPEFTKDDVNDAKPTGDSQYAAHFEGFSFVAPRDRGNTTTDDMLELTKGMKKPAPAAQQ